MVHAGGLGTMPSGATVGRPGTGGTGGAVGTPVYDGSSGGTGGTRGTPVGTMPLGYPSSARGGGAGGRGAAPSISCRIPEALEATAGSEATTPLQTLTSVLGIMDG